MLHRQISIPLKIQKELKKASISPTHKPEDLALEEWQRMLRKEFGAKQNFVLKNIGDHPIFSEFSVTNPQSGKVYRVAIRSDKPGENYCSCPDYSINDLGTCKHIEFTLFALKKRKGAGNAFRQGFRQPYSEVYLSYGLMREVRFRPGKDAPPRLLEHAKTYFDDTGRLFQDRILDFHTFLEGIRPDNGHEVRCYDNGAQLLTSLSRMLSQPGQSVEKTFKAMIHRDNRTGRDYLQIPLPKPEVVKNVFAVVGDLLAMAIETRNIEE